MIELTYLFRIGVSLLLSSLIGMEREHNDKPYGFRTIILITLGATLITIFTLRFIEITKVLNASFDAIRAIAYYSLAAMFGTKLMQKTEKGRWEGVTSVATVLCLFSVGFFCGVGDYFLAIISTLVIYLVLKFKYVQRTVRKRKKKRRRKKK